jgi:hypothetical protein
MRAIVFLFFLAALSTGRAIGQELVVGGFTNLNSGLYIEITPNQAGGWAANLGFLGQHGTIRPSTHGGGNIEVDGERVRCWFRVLGGLDWVLVDSSGPDSERNCSFLIGLFEKVR